MTSQILVTGFERFGEMSVNPTQQLVDGIASRSPAGVELHTLVLPVEYDGCLEVLLTTVDRLQPDAVVLTGLAVGRSAVTPERIGINVKDTAPADPLADNAGRSPVDEAISDGPDGLFSTLPIREIQRALVEAGIPSSISNTAGTYICNNTMYGLLDHLRRHERNVPAGFIHFPASTEMAAVDPRLPSMPLAMMGRALEIAVETVSDGLRRR